MHNSKMRTDAVPDVNQLGAGGDGSQSGTPVPRLLYQAGDVPMRLLVRNVSFGNTIYLAFEANVLQMNPPGVTSYELPPGAADVFLLAPGQKMFAIADGVGARASHSASDALPVDVPKT